MRCYCLAVKPYSFLFYPAKPEKSETETFTAYFNACAVSATRKQPFSIVTHRAHKPLLSIVASLSRICNRGKHCGVNRRYFASKTLTLHLRLLLSTPCRPSKTATAQIAAAVTCGY
jgi:hypothetical protein